MVQLLDKMTLVAIMQDQEAGGSKLLARHFLNHISWTDYCFLHIVLSFFILRLHSGSLCRAFLSSIYILLCLVFSCERCRPRVLVCNGPLISLSHEGDREYDSDSDLELDDERDLLLSPSEIESQQQLRRQRLKGSKAASTEGKNDDDDDEVLETSHDRTTRKSARHKAKQQQQRTPTQFQPLNAQQHSAFLYTLDHQLDVLFSLLIRHHVHIVVMLASSVVPDQALHRFRSSGVALVQLFSPFDLRRLCQLLSILPVRLASLARSPSGAQILAPTQSAEAALLEIVRPSNSTASFLHVIPLPPAERMARCAKDSSCARPSVTTHSGAPLMWASLGSPRFCCILLRSPSDGICEQYSAFLRRAALVLCSWAVSNDTMFSALISSHCSSSSSSLSVSSYSSFSSCSSASTSIPSDSVLHWLAHSPLIAMSSSSLSLSSSLHTSSVSSAGSAPSFSPSLELLSVCGGSAAELQLAFSLLASVELCDGGISPAWISNRDSRNHSHSDTDLNLPLPIISCPASFVSLLFL